MKTRSGNTTPNTTSTTPRQVDAPALSAGGSTSRPPSGKGAASAGRPPLVPVLSTGATRSTRRGVSSASGGVRKRKGISSSTGKSSSSKKKATQSKASSSNLRPPTNRKTPTMAECVEIRKRLSDGYRTVRFPISGGGKSRPISINKYGMTDTPYFGLQLEASIEFGGRPTLPVDHPNHDECLKQCMVNRLPPRDILFNTLASNEALAAELRSNVHDKYDLDSDKSRKFNIIEIIAEARREASGAGIIEDGAVVQQQQQQNHDPRCSSPADDTTKNLAALSGVVYNLATSQQKTQEQIHSTQEQLHSTQEQLQGFQTASVARFTTIEAGQKDLEKRVCHLEELTTSNAKNWASFQEIREEYHRNSQEMGGCRLFASPRTSPSTTVVQLDDITVEEERYLMTKFDGLLAPNFDPTPLSDVHKENLEQFSGDLKGAPLTSMSAEFCESDFIMLKDPSLLTHMESFTEFYEQLGENFLVIPCPGDDQSAVYVANTIQDTFTETFLPAVGGVTVQFDFTVLKGDLSLMVHAPSSQAATDTVEALRQLAMNGRARIRDIEIEARFSDCNQNETPIGLPFQSERYESTATQCSLELKNVIVAPEQMPNLVANFEFIKFENASFSIDGGGALVDAITKRQQNHSLQRIECRNTVPFEEEPLLRLVRWLGDEGRQSFKLVLQNSTVGTLWDDMPLAVMNEIESQISTAFANGTKLAHLELVYEDVSKSSLRSVLESAVKTAFQSVDEESNRAFRMVHDEDFLPIVIKGSREKVAKISTRVKAWAHEALGTVA